MRDLQHQLADYWAEITEDLEAPVLDDVLVERVGEGEVRALSPRLDTRRRPGWVTAAAAFGLVVVAGFAAWMVGIGGETDEVADDTAATWTWPAASRAIPWAIASGKYPR